MKRSMHYLYLGLLLFSAVAVWASFYIPSTSWSSIVMSIGCGGIASVTVAWLIDLQNHRNKKAENEKKYEIILRRYVKLYRRLVWTTINECYGLYSDKEERTLQEWLSILSDEKRYGHSLQQYSTMKHRCQRLSGNLVALQKNIENFQVESATLILNEFPDIEIIMDFFERQHTHAWGSLKQLEIGYYKNFCDTTYLLYKEFINQFPQYKLEFPEKYSASILKEWKI